MRWSVITLAAAAISLTGPAWSDGAIVRWNGIVGLQGHESDTANLVVGDLSPGPNWTWADSGHATLNLATGDVTIVVKYVSWASNNPATSHPMGSVLDGAPFQRSGKFVCYYPEDRHSFEMVETGPFLLNATGSASYQSRIDLPAVCRENPDQIVFVVGGYQKPNYFLFGSGRVVLGSW